MNLLNSPPVSDKMENRVASIMLFDVKSDSDKE